MYAIQIYLLLLQRNIYSTNIYTTKTSNCFIASFQTKKNISFKSRKNYFTANAFLIFPEHVNSPVIPSFKRHYTMQMRVAHCIGASRKVFKLKNHRSLLWKLNAACSERDYYIRPTSPNWR